MKVTLKGNTGKERKFFPATKDKPAMLYMSFADKIVNHDGSEKTVWYKVRVCYKYAEVINSQIPEDTSRAAILEGTVVDAPEVYNGKGQVVVWAKEITWLDNKWPAKADHAPETPEEPAIAEPTEVDDLDCPW